MKKQGGYLPFIAVAILVGLLLGWLFDEWSYKIPGVEAFRPTAEAYADKYDVDPALVMAIIAAESSGNPRAVSRSGAIGLMQLMPDTAKMIAENLGESTPGKSDLMEPERNIRYGAYYLNMLSEQFGRSPEVLLAAYNAGPARVFRWLSANQDNSAEYVVNHCPFNETRYYIYRAMAFYESEKSNYGKN